MACRLIGTPHACGHNARTPTFDLAHLVGLEHAAFDADIIGGPASALGQITPSGLTGSSGNLSPIAVTEKLIAPEASEVAVER